MITGTLLLCHVHDLIASELEDRLDGPDVFALAISCRQVWHKMSSDKDGSHKRVLHLRRLVAMVSGDAFHSCVRNLHLPSLTQMHISATVCEIRKVVLHIAEVASDLTNLRVLQLTASEGKGYPSICDAWVS